MPLDNFAVPHYRINRSSAKISDLPTVTVLDNGAKFILAHGGHNYSVTAATIITVISNAVLALGGGADSFDPLTLPINTATLDALNNKANLSHTHEINQVNGLATYVTNAINLAISGLSYASSNHQHTVGEVTGLQLVLDSKALASDIPPILQSISALTTSKADADTVTQIQTSISTLLTLVNSKASQADLTALTDVVATKASQSTLTTLGDAVATKASQADLSALTTVVNSLIQTVAGLANSTHVHAMSDITGLTTELNNIANSVANLSSVVSNISSQYVISGAVQW